jgi:molybdate-binding protein/DNA-binding XRE family transcriptional regulator
LVLTNATYTFDIRAMAPRMRNGVSRRRKALGLTQEQLARRAQMSRQSLNAIELGRAVPSTSASLRLARVLESTVEELFWLDDSPTSISAELAEADHSPQGRAVVASIDGRWVAHRLPATDGLSVATPADAVFTSGGRLRLLAQPQSASDNLLCAGCAPAMGILAGRATAAAAGRVVWLDRPSTAALELLRRGQVHVAGAHLFDEATGECNLPDVRRLFPHRAMLVFNLVRWEAGILAAAGNPKRIKGAADLSREDLTLARRTSDSGAQRLLDRLVPNAGGRGPMATSHLDAARMVAMGLADASIAIESAARAFGLTFIPVAEERFDLIVPRELAQDPRIVRLLDITSTRVFRTDVGGLGGLVTRQSGSLIACTAA